MAQREKRRGTDNTEQCITSKVHSPEEKQDMASAQLKPDEKGNKLSLKFEDISRLSNRIETNPMLMSINFEDHYASFAKTGYLNKANQRMLQRRETRKSALDSLIKKNSDTQYASSEKKNKLNKLLNQYQALAKKRISSSDMLVAIPKSLKNSCRPQFRSESVKLDNEEDFNAKQNKMSLTSYSTRFKLNQPKFANRSVIDENHSPKLYDKNKIKRMKETLSMFYQKESILTPYKPNKVKFNPHKIKPLFNYDFTQYKQPEPEEEQEVTSPTVQDPQKGKAPQKGKDDTQELNIPMFKMSKNILFEKIETIDLDSNIEVPKFL